MSLVGIQVWICLGVLVLIAVPLLLIWAHLAHIRKVYMAVRETAREKWYVAQIGGGDCKIGHLTTPIIGLGISPWKILEDRTSLVDREQSGRASMIQRARKRDAPWVALIYTSELPEKEEVISFLLEVSQDTTPYYFPVVTDPQPWHRLELIDLMNGRSDEEMVSERCLKTGTEMQEKIAQMIYAIRQLPVQAPSSLVA